MAKRETTDYVILEIRRVGRSEPENLKGIEKVIGQICEQFSKGAVEVAEHTGPNPFYYAPITETLD